MSEFVTIQSGEDVKVNDHVYCSPTWAARDGTPYSVARIMQFLPPANKDGTVSPEDKKRAAANGGFTRARLAWYYRPSDVSDRPTADSRLLLAAIYSETCDISQLRAKCYVAHRDKISDLAGWKKRPDHFYFTRLFDPYIKKEFEVLQTSQVRNIPEHVREVLTARYEYIVAEKEIVPNLTDTLHICDTCGDWCPQAQTIQCDRCSRSWHMSCLTPPLSVKPSRGYGWTCADCARQHAQDVDSSLTVGARHITPPGANGGGNGSGSGSNGSNKPRSAAKNISSAARARGRPRKDKGLAEKEEALDVRTFRMWPFRYFGLHTVAEDTLDEDDFIFPRTVTRVGPKYQASVPAGPGYLAGHSGGQERGGPDTVETLSAVHQMSPKDIQEFEEAKKKLTASEELRFNVDWMTEAVRRLSEAYLTRHDFGTVSMKSVNRLLKWKSYETPYVDREWTEEEKSSFEDAIEKHGAELRAVRLEMRTRSHPEVVRYYGHWKNGKLREENQRKRDGTWVPPSDPTSLSDDEHSVTSATSGKNPPSCGACRTRTSEVWYKAPKGLPSSRLCDTCGANWRRYADLSVRPTREEAGSSIVKGKAADKREGTPLQSTVVKKAKTQTSTAAPSASASASSRSTPTVVQAPAPPPPAPALSGPQIQCVACNKKGPVGQVLRCQQCKLQVHAGTSGAVVSKDDAESWTCELCQNEKTEEASLTTDCLLCPRRRRDRKRAGMVIPPPDSFLRVCKPTEGQGWAHVLCSVFHPETSFTDDKTLRLVEGISTVPASKWSKECVICKEKGGAVIRCTECPREFHISCSWKAGYKTGFELLPVKQRSRDSASVITFNGTPGTLVPIIYCKSHDQQDSEPPHRRVLPICEVDQLSGKTLLQIYCHKYKRAQIDHTYGLMRKARRLDEILCAVTVATAPETVSPHMPSDVDQTCDQCQTQYSPYFHSHSGGRWLCHKCHFNREGGRKAGITSA